MLTKYLISAFALLSGATAFAGTAPTATLAAGDSFAQWTPSVSTPVGTVGDNNINQNNVLFWLDEGKFSINTSEVAVYNHKQTRIIGYDYFVDGTQVDKATYTLLTPFNGKTVESYLLTFDPLKTSNMSGSVSFASTILGTFSTTKQLSETTPFFHASGVTYNFVSATGLESQDENLTSFNGQTLSLNWKAANPGDNLRVLVAAVPEPESYAMLLAGLGLIGAVASRRKAA